MSTYLQGVIIYLKMRTTVSGTLNSYIFNYRSTQGLWLSWVERYFKPYRRNRAETGKTLQNKKRRADHPAREGEWRGAAASARALRGRGVDRSMGRDFPSLWVVV